jgi:hypothetical protein
VLLMFFRGSEVFPCFFLSCKANVKVKPSKTGHGPHYSINFCVLLHIVYFVSFYEYVFVCVIVYCAAATGWLPNCS